MSSAPSDGFPSIADVGITGCLVSFGNRLNEATNRAALAFRTALDAAAWDGVEETSTSLTSAFLRFDPLQIETAELRAKLDALLASRDWYDTPLPEGRRLWRVPCVFGGEDAPQFAEAAAAAGLSEAQALDSLQQARVRVLTIGFAPGQPYMGELPEVWDIPRQQQLTPRVPAGALVIAIRQLIIFSGPTPTGWRHIGQTRWENFRLGREPEFALRMGDEMQFHAVDAAELDRLAQDDDQGLGGATCEVIA